MIPDLGGDPTLWWILSSIITCGTLAGALIPELIKVFTTTKSAHVREVVTSSEDGGASLNILSGFVAGNFSRFLAGLGHAGADGRLAYVLQHAGPVACRDAGAAPIFAFGLVAFGFLGMGPVTIAVDSYGPVTDNAQSVYELCQIEAMPNIKAEIKTRVRLRRGFRARQAKLEKGDGAGNTFKATAKPVLIGTAVVGATTMVFGIIMLLTNWLDHESSTSCRFSTRHSCWAC